VEYDVDESNEIKEGSFNPYGNEQMEAIKSRVPVMDEFFSHTENYKGMVLDHCHRYKTKEPTFSFEMSGPAHAPRFHVTAKFDGEVVTDVGMNRREVEQRLCYRLWLYIQNTQPFGPDVRPAKLTEEYHAQKAEEAKRAEVKHKQVNDVEEQMFFYNMMVAFRSYADLTPEERIYHPFASIMDLGDREAAARIAAMRKVGSFNMYGNEQMSQYTQCIVTKPVIVKVNASYTCSSTCIFASPVNIVGIGDDEMSAFGDWLMQVTQQIEYWEPTMFKPPTDFLKKLQTLPKPPTGHPLSDLWDTDPEQLVYTFWDTIKIGSYNPYGNGQPMSKQQWLVKHKVRVAGWDAKKKEEAYKSYLKSTKKTIATVKKRAPPQVRTVRPMPYSKRAQGYEQRAKIKLSGCAKMYATALRCPFWWQDRSCSSKVPKGLNNEENPCIPMFPAIKTRKFYATAKGTMGIPNGFTSGWIAFAPRRLANNNNGGNDVACPILYSLASVTGTNNLFPGMDTSAAWASGSANLNTDYSTAALVASNGVGIRYRIVGAGIRVKYIGPLLGASGIYGCVEMPDHETLSGLSLDQIGQMDSYFAIAVSEQLNKPDPWVYLTYTPVDVMDFDFETDTVANATWSAKTNMNHCIGMILSGIPTGANYFEWEAIVHYEAIGREVRSKTDTPSDVVGASVVQNAIKPETQKTLNTAETVMGAIKKGTEELTSSTLVQAAGKAIEVAKSVAPIFA
jgi:hypothetical protein